MSKVHRLPFESEVQLLLLQNSLGAMPFNILVAGILCLELYLRGAAANALLPWFFALTALSILRMAYALYGIRNGFYRNHLNTTAILFNILAFLSGALWGTSYFIFMPIAKGVDEAILLLVLGGVSTAGLVSLSMSLPAYIAFLVPIFAPAILYNYALMQMHNAIIATLILLFASMIFIVARTNTQLFRKLFRLSNQKDELIFELAVSNKKLEASNQEVRLLSITDPLTSLHNRRYFDRTLPGELARARRGGFPLNLMLLDIDNFKYINDTFGHPYGDNYLIFVANLLKKTMRRSTDLVVRLGGDEFAVILGDMPLQEVQSLAEHIRQQFTRENPHPEVTLSIGIIHAIAGSESNINTLVSAADEMLYRAKEHGKDQIMLKAI